MVGKEGHWERCGMRSIGSGGEGGALGAVGKRGIGSIGEGEVWKGNELYGQLLQIIYLCVHASVCECAFMHVHICTLNM